MDFVHLQGSEDVRSAGSAMRAAAEEMSRAARSISVALERHERFLDEWLFRLMAALAEHADGAEEGGGG